MGLFGTVYEGPVGPEGAERVVIRTVPWAVGLPVAAVGAGVLTQYPYGMWVGVVIALAVVATAAILAGGVWHRPGAATVAAVAALALPFFAGPAAYEAYMKNAGDPVDAVVISTGETPNSRGTDLSVCRVVDTAGDTWELSQQQNCYGQFKAKQRVVLYQDPMGGLDPWVEAERGTATEPTAPAITVGLAAVFAASLLYAGAKRRTEAEVTAAKRRRHGPPRTAEPVD